MIKYVSVTTAFKPEHSTKNYRLFRLLFRPTYREDLDVKDDEVECEREGHGAHEPHVGPGWHGHQGLVLGQAVHGVQHLNGYQHGQSHCHGVGVSEDLAVDSLEKRC